MNYAVFRGQEIEKDCQYLSFPSSRIKDLSEIRGFKNLTELISIYLPDNEITEIPLFGSYSYSIKKKDEKASSK